MKKFAIILTLCFISFWSIAQEKVNLVVYDVDRSFTGIQTFKIRESNYSNYYYDLTLSMLTIHHVDYKEKENYDMGIVYSYIQYELLVTDIDLKNTEIYGDCKDDCLLAINTKKLKNEIIKYYYLTPDGFMSKTNSIFLRFDKEKDAKAFIEELKLANKKD